MVGDVEPSQAVDYLVVGLVGVVAGVEDGEAIECRVRVVQREHMTTRWGGDQQLLCSARPPGDPPDDRRSVVGLPATATLELVQQPTPGVVNGDRDRAIKKPGDRPVGPDLEHTVDARHQYRLVESETRCGSCRGR